jgi:hypothetical protein
MGVPAMQLLNTLGCPRLALESSSESFDQTRCAGWASAGNDGVLAVLA